VQVYTDAGISGAKGRVQRPGLDQMRKDARRRNFDVVMTWAIDRLGRSLIDLLGTIQHLEAVGVDLYLDQQSIDTTTPMGKLVFQITGAFAEFERSILRQRIKAGLKRAVAQGTRLGRPKVDLALTTFTELLWKADRALYQAKEGGRNRVEWAVPGFFWRSQDGGMRLGRGPSPLY
jgi:DNA invertase Pin-like site-specific DNA recombinase